MSKILRDAAERIKSLFSVVNIHEQYAATFNTADGQAVLRHLMKVGHFFDSSYVPGDPTATAFREGQRHLVLSILRAVNKDTSELIKQVEEGLQ